MRTDLLTVLETYYDAAPRPLATVEEVGPFTLFLRADPSGWPYYARPRLGLDTDVTAADVTAVLDRQRALDVPRALEWVHETTPSLAAAAEAAGLAVHRCPLLVLTGVVADVPAPAGRVALLEAGSPDLDAVTSAVHAGFGGTDDVEPREAVRQPPLIRAGLLAMAGAYDATGAAVGGGSHSPRGQVTELAGIAVLPRARKQGYGAAITAALAADANARGITTVFLSAQDDAVARVYERVGFVRVGTACVAETD